MNHLDILNASWRTTKLSYIAQRIGTIKLDLHNDMAWQTHKVLLEQSAIIRTLLDSDDSHSQTNELLSNIIVNGLFIYNIIKEHPELLNNNTIWPIVYQCLFVLQNSLDKPVVKNSIETLPETLQNFFAALKKLPEVLRNIAPLSPDPLLFSEVARAWEQTMPEQALLIIHPLEITSSIHAHFHGDPVLISFHLALLEKGFLVYDPFNKPYVRNLRNAKQAIEVTNLLFSLIPPTEKEKLLSYIMKIRWTGYPREIGKKDVNASLNAIAQKGAKGIEHAVMGRPHDLLLSAGLIDSQKGAIRRQEANTLLAYQHIQRSLAEIYLHYLIITKNPEQAYESMKRNSYIKMLIKILSEKYGPTTLNTLLSTNDENWKNAVSQYIKIATTERHYHRDTREIKVFEKLMRYTRQHTTAGLGASLRSCVGMIQSLRDNKDLTEALRRTTSGLIVLNASAVIFPEKQEISPHLLPDVSFINRRQGKLIRKHKWDAVIAGHFLNAFISIFDTIEYPLPTAQTPQLWATQESLKIFFDILQKLHTSLANKYRELHFPNHTRLLTDYGGSILVILQTPELEELQSQLVLLANLPDTLLAFAQKLAETPETASLVNHENLALIQVVAKELRRIIPKD